MARLEEALVNEVAGDDEVADGVEDVGEGAAGEDDGDDEAAAAVEAAAAAAAEEAKQYKHSRISFNPAAAPAPAKITVVKAVSSRCRGAALLCRGCCTAVLRQCCVQAVLSLAVQCCMLAHHMGV